MCRVACTSTVLCTAKHCMRDTHVLVCVCECVKCKAVAAKRACVSMCVRVRVGA